MHLPEGIDLIGKQLSAVSASVNGLLWESEASLYPSQCGHGCISVTANVKPRLCAEMLAAAGRGDFNEARRVHQMLMPLHLALFMEPSPAGVKYAMSKLGLCSNEVRMPLAVASAAMRSAIDHALEGVA